MALTDSIKRAPRWAWFTVAGVGLGAASIKLWRDRAAPSETEMLDPSADPTSSVGSPYAPGPGGSSTGVIVPPVIINPQGSDPNIGVSGLQDLYIGAVQDIVQGWGDVYGPIADLLPGLTTNMMSLAMAGGPPPQRPEQLQVVVSAPPVAQSAPAPAPAPVVSAPAVVSGGAQHPWGTGPDPCTGEYPFYQDQGTRKGKCYKVVCKGGEKNRWYANGDKVGTGDKC